MKSFLKERLDEHQREGLRRLAGRVLSPLLLGSLEKLATVHGSDKWGSHWYIPHYRRHLGPRRWRKQNLLEIGVGGYEDPRLGGRSLRMWKYYLPRATILSLDIHDKSALEERRIRIYQGDQTDEEILRRIWREAGGLDIVIDDGSHVNGDVIRTFEILFPLLAPDGLYVVEDTQTSYWPEYGGRSDVLTDPGTIMGYFKGLADGLNHAELLRPGYEPGYLDRHVVGLHFYHNLVFIQKGLNREGSNLVEANERYSAELPLDSREPSPPPDPYPPSDPSPPAGR